MEQFAKQRVLEIQRGLFLIKYESAENPGRPPKVMISVDPGSEDRVDVILPPGSEEASEEAVLWSPGACIVARSMGGGRLRVAVVPKSPNGSIGARVQVIALSNDPAGVRQEAESADLDLSEFGVLGHVAGRGDVFADPEDWIAGPTAPSRIEGFAIQWPAKPGSFGLRYAVKVGGQQPATTQFVQAGQFAGTRGRALPLVGATLEISGPSSQGCQLVVDAIFLGSPQMRVTGRRVVLSGPTGREPLVGLRIGIEPVNRARSVAPEREEKISAGRVRRDAKITPAPSRLAVQSVASEKRSGRVRVFRSGKARGKADRRSEA